MLSDGDGLTGAASQRLRDRVLFVHRFQAMFIPDLVCRMVPIELEEASEWGRTKATFRDLSIEI